MRSVHPAPPGSINVRGKAYGLRTLENPLRKDTANFAKNVKAGADVYIKNCYYCHGDFLDGKGPYADFINPPPANFQDVGTIAMLQESFLFWRIMKGGPGLPSEGTPWDSAMPAWEPILSEQEVWQVILFMYEFTGHKPRRWE
ncbi:MAG: cytochrome c [Nitrospirae bacterium]|nr:cytochrome c [Nitrospirota bacterium]